MHYRSGDRSAPHNLYSSTDSLWSYAPPTAHGPQQQFRYRTDEDPTQGQVSSGVGVSLDSIDVTWTWDPGSQLYLRTMEGSPHYDRGSSQISTNNVLVLVMNYVPGISGSPDAQTVGSGEAFVFTNGRFVHGQWIRRDRTQPFQLFDDKHRPILLTPGRTFVELPADRHDHAAAGGLRVTGDHEGWWRRRDMVDDPRFDPLKTITTGTDAPSMSVVKPSLDSEDQLVEPLEAHERLVAHALDGLGDGWILNHGTDDRPPDPNGRVGDKTRRARRAVD